MTTTPRADHAVRPGPGYLADRIIAVLKADEYGWTPTYRISRKLEQRTPTVYAVLRQMEAAGMVRRNLRYSTVNSVAWEIVR